MPPTPKHSPNYAPFLLPITGCSSYHHSRRLPSSLPTALLTVCSPFCTAGLSGPQPGLFPSLKRPSPTGSTGSRREVSGRSGYAAVLRAQTRMWVGGGLVLRARMGPRVSSSSSSRSPVGRVALRAPPERPSQETRPGNPLSSGAGGSPYKDERVLHPPGRGGTTGAHEKQREEDRARTAPGAGRNAGIAQVRTHDIPLRCTLNPIIPKTLGGGLRPAPSAPGQCPGPPRPSICSLKSPLDPSLRPQRAPFAWKAPIPNAPSNSSLGLPCVPLPRDPGFSFPKSTERCLPTPSDPGT